MSNNKMAMVSVVNWQPTGGLMVQAICLVQRSAATWHCATFIAWTRVNSHNPISKIITVSF